MNIQTVKSAMIKLAAAYMAPQLVKKATLQDKLAEYGIGMNKKAADVPDYMKAANPLTGMPSTAAAGKAGVGGYVLGKLLNQRAQKTNDKKIAPTAQSTAAQVTPAVPQHNPHYDKAPGDPSQYINMDLGYGHTAADIPLKYYNTTGKWNDYRPGELPWQNAALEKVREVGETSAPYGADHEERRAAGKSYVDAMREAEQQRQFLQNRQKLGEQIRDNIRAQGAMPIPDPYVRMENEWSPGKGYENDSFGWQNPLAGKSSLHPGLLNSGTELYGDRSRNVDWNWRGFPNYPAEGAYNWNSIKGNAGLVPVERER